MSDQSRMPHAWQESNHLLGRAPWGGPKSHFCEHCPVCGYWRCEHPYSRTCEGPPIPDALRREDEAREARLAVASLERMGISLTPEPTDEEWAWLQQQQEVRIE